MEFTKEEEVVVIEPLEDPRPSRQGEPLVAPVPEPQPEREKVPA